MKLYLAGPMTGYKDHNYPMFFRAAAELRIAGYAVMNPAEIRPRLFALKKTRREILTEDLQLLLTCQGVALLPGWEESQGANLERATAVGLDMPVVLVSNILGWSESLLRGEKL